MQWFDLVWFLVCFHSAGHFVVHETAVFLLDWFGVWTMRFYCLFANCFFHRGIRGLQSPAWDKRSLS